MEARRSQISKWIENISGIRAVKNSIIFQTFCRVPLSMYVPKLKLLSSLPPDIPSRVPLPVQAIHSDVISQVVFVVGGMPKSSIMFVSRRKIRGFLSVYGIQDSQCSGKEDDRVVNNRVVWSSDKHSMMRLCPTQKFNVGVMSVAFERTRRSVVIGLSTGPILFYYLSEYADSLTFCAELDCHSHLLDNIFIDSWTNNMIAASKSCVSTFNMAEGLQKSTFDGDASFQITGIAFYVLGQVVFAGSRAGQVRAYDMKTPRPQISCTVNIEKDIKAKGNGKVCVAFVEETALLYCTYFHSIMVYTVPPGKCMGKFSLGQFLCISLEPSLSNISSLVVFNKGNFISVTTTRGAVCVYAMVGEVEGETEEEALSRTARSLSSKKSPTQASASAASVMNYLTSSKGGVVRWNTIIHESDPAIRDWLRSHGVDTSGAYARANLLKLVAEFVAGDESKVTVLEMLEAIALTLRPGCICKDCFLTFHLDDTIVDENLAESNYNTLRGVLDNPATEDAAERIGEDGAGAKPNFDCGSLKNMRIITSHFIEEMSCLAFGTESGITYFVSVAQFLPPLLPQEKFDLDLVRRRLAELPTSAAGIKGSTKSKRGKGHELDATEDGDMYENEGERRSRSASFSLWASFAEPQSVPR